jgi:hypothetical protein
MLTGQRPISHFLLHFQLTCHNLLKQLPIEAMDLKQPESQASQEPPAPSELPRPTSTPASSTTEVLSPEELELIKQHRASTKKSRMDQGWDELLSALAAKDVELSDLDFGLQQELRASPQARAAFLALDITTPDALHNDPDKGKLQKIDLTNKRPFTDLQSVETPRGPNEGCNATVPPSHLLAQQSIRA